jgi:hypothetical protein
LKAQSWLSLILCQHPHHATPVHSIRLSDMEDLRSGKKISMKLPESNTCRYCRVILVGKRNDKEMKTTLYTIYKDVFVKVAGKWLIKERTSNFVHRDVEEVK